jgi:hypothetical protein
MLVISRDIHFSGFFKFFRNIQEIPSIAATWVRTEVAPLCCDLVGGGYENSS